MLRSFAGLGHISAQLSVGCEAPIWRIRLLGNSLRYSLVAGCAIWGLSPDRNSARKYERGPFALLIMVYLCCIVQGMHASQEEYASLHALQKTHSPLKVGIMTGVMWEAEDLLKQFQLGYTTSQRALRDFYHGTLWGIDTVLVSARCGKVAAAITATMLILEEHVDLIILMGAAGAIADGLHVGDVIIASSLVQHDVDCRPFIPRFTIPFLNVREFKPDLTLQQMAVQASEAFVHTELTQCLTASIISEFQLAPKVYSGLVASGDQFVADRARKEELKQKLPGLLCVEMEGAAVAQVCYEMMTPLIVVRILSDNSEAKAAGDCRKFMKSAAAIYISQIVKNLLRELGHRTQDLQR